MSNKLIYIASPYTYPSKRTDCQISQSACREVEEYRYGQVLEFTTRLMDTGNNVFSPIVYSHHIAKLSNEIGGDFLAWKEFDELMLSKSDALIVFCIDGYDTSVGVDAEIKYAAGLGLPVMGYQPGDPAAGDELATFLLELEESI